MEQHSYRRLSGSSVAPGLRRTKSVRASFRMLGSRWKPTQNKNDVIVKADRKKDIVFERFGKELNEDLKNRVHNDTSLKTKIFNGFSKENVASKTICYGEVPKNVAPKAAALLQIPLPNAPIGTNKKLNESFRISRKMGNMIVNSQQFNDFRKSTTENGNDETGRTATIRRSPYWTHNAIYSKIFSLNKL